MGEPPYDDPDTLDLMRSDAHEVRLADSPDETSTPCVGPADANPADGFEVPTAAIALGELHFHLD